MVFFSTISKWLARIFRHAQYPISEDEQRSYTRRFHEAVGGALTSWTIMETRLVFIAAILLKTSPRKTGLIFYSIINFQVWITIISELFSMESDFAAFSPRWEKIAKRLRAEKDHRDRLAHNLVIKSEPGLQPSPLDFRSKSQAFKPLTLEEVMTFRERVGVITDDLGALMDKMMPRLAASATSREKSPQQGPDQAPL